VVQTHHITFGIFSYTNVCSSSGVSTFLLPTAAVKLVAHRIIVNSHRPTGLNVTVDRSRVWRCEFVAYTFTPSDSYFAPLPGRGAQHCNKCSLYLCASDCLSARLRRKLTADLHQIFFYACYLWLRLGPLMALAIC